MSIDIRSTDLGKWAEDEFQDGRNGPTFAKSANEGHPGGPKRIATTAAKTTPPAVNVHCYCHYLDG